MLAALTNCGATGNHVTINPSSPPPPPPPPFPLFLQAEETLAGGGSVKTSTILRLKYLIYKNLATIAKETGDLSAAVDAYIQVYHMTITTPT